MERIDRRRGLAMILQGAVTLGIGLTLPALQAEAQMSPRSRPCIPSARACAPTPAAGTSPRSIVKHGR
jgi:hypothetical protein